MFVLKINCNIFVKHDLQITNTVNQRIKNKIEF